MKKIFNRQKHHFSKENDSKKSFSKKKLRDDKSTEDISALSNEEESGITEDVEADAILAAETAKTLDDAGKTPEDKEGVNENIDKDVEGYEDRNDDSSEDYEDGDSINEYIDDEEADREYVDDDGEYENKDDEDSEDEEAGSDAVEKDGEYEDGNDEEDDEDEEDEEDEEDSEYDGEDEYDGKEDDNDEDDDEYEDGNYDDDNEDEEDDDNEDDDGEDDDDESDDSIDDRSGSEGSWEESRRAYRRKRRIRNQIIAYGVVLVLLIVLAIAGAAAGQRISKYIKENKKEDDQIVQQDAPQEDGSEHTPEEVIIEAPPEIEEATLDEQLEEIVNNCISVMPLEDKVAGLFVITPEALTGVGTVIQAGEGTQEALSNYAVGGLIYFAKNIQDREQLTQMLSNTVSMSKYPIFLAVDEEGGDISRIANSGIDVVQVDDMLSIGTAGDTGAAYEAGITIGSYLNELGFNLDFAPVADVLSDASKSSLGTRSFGSNPEICADMISNVVDGIQGTSVSACLKHFPGIGSSGSDTHDGKVELTKTLEEMKNSDFIPFKAGIDVGADLVMVSHVTALELDEEGVPSSLSKTVISDLLRGELGYDGVIITDALDMGAIVKYYTSEEAAVNAINAGADMLLMPEDFKDAYDGVLAAVQEGRISEERIDESLRRIYRIKYANKLEN